MIACGGMNEKHSESAAQDRRCRREILWRSAAAAMSKNLREEVGSHHRDVQHLDRAEKLQLSMRARRSLARRNTHWATLIEATMWKFYTPPSRLIWQHALCCPTCRLRRNPRLVAARRGREARRLGPT